MESESAADATKAKETIEKELPEQVREGYKKKKEKDKEDESDHHLH